MFSLSFSATALARVWALLAAALMQQPPRERRLQLLGGPDQQRARKSIQVGVRVHMVIPRSVAGGGYIHAF